LFFQPKQYFFLITNQSIVFFSRLIGTAERLQGINHGTWRSGCTTVSTGWVSCYLALLPAVHANYSYTTCRWHFSNFNVCKLLPLPASWQCHTRTRLPGRDFFSTAHSVFSRSANAIGVYNRSLLASAYRQAFHDKQHNRWRFTQIHSTSSAVQHSNSENKFRELLRCSLFLYLVYLQQWHHT
jgi:hypothetical protein